MGKTAKLSNSKSSSSSASSSKIRLQSNISTHKKKMSAKKMHNKQRKSIQKLFEKLINERVSTCESNDNSVILIEENATPSPSRKRKSTSDEYVRTKIQKKSCESIIIVNDIDDSDELIINDSPCTKTSKNNRKTPPNKSPPLSYSTPLSNDIVTSKFNFSNVSIINKINSNNHSVESNSNEKTKNINPDSYLTIDLTNESDASKTADNTVIDVDRHVSDCTFVSANSSFSMSGDPDVTVVKVSQFRNNKMKKFADGIAKMSATEKGHLLEMITKNIFNGCKTPTIASNTSINKAAVTRATETIEDTYIKEVILGPSNSRNSIGSNIYNPTKDQKHKKGLRMVVIDGSNVAMEHGNGKMFSVKGLKICIDYFLKRGHIVKAFVPRFRCKYGKSTDPRLLDALERQGLVVYTPSRELPGRFICSYDDRYIVQCAAEFDGVIVTGDNYRDLMAENPRWRFIIENRLLPFTWVDDMIMFPKDPLGRNGPTLDRLLRHSD